MKNPLIPISIIIAGALVAGAIIFTNTAKPKVADAPGGSDVELREVDKKDHVQGNPDADVVIVEYSDIQCPYCEKFHKTMKEVMDTYGKDGKVAWVYRHHPLDNFYGAPNNLHPEARPAAIASECVAKEAGNDAFWTYVDSLFDQQSGLGTELYVSEAIKLGVDESKFKECLNDEKILDLVVEDEQEGDLKFGTPYSVAIRQKDGKMVPINGALPYEAVKNIIDGLLK